MARITIEDCIKRVSNPFDLVLFASERAKELNQGEATDLDKENLKIVNNNPSLKFLKNYTPFYIKKYLSF